MEYNNHVVCRAYNEAIELELVKLQLNNLGYTQDDITNMLNEGGLDKLKKIAKGALKKTIPAIALGAAALGGASKAQAETPFGWRAGTGQPTATVAGMLGGALAGSQIGKTVSKGSDASKIGAGVGLVAGGALANYLSGPKGKQQSPQQVQQQTPSGYGKGTGSGTGNDFGGNETGTAKEKGPSLGNEIETVKGTEKDVEGGMELSAQKGGGMPSGIEDANGMVKSPFSDFVFSKKSPGIQSGQTIRDPFTGQSFKIP